jgi:hypothetical protein
VGDGPKRPGIRCALGEPVKALAVGDVEDERLHGDTVPRLRGQLACGVQDGCLFPVDQQNVIGDGEPDAGCAVP